MLPAFIARHKIRTLSGLVDVKLYGDTAYDAYVTLPSGKIYTVSLAYTFHPGYAQAKRIEAHFTRKDGTRVCRTIPTTTQTQYIRDAIEAAHAARVLFHDNKVTV